MFLAVPLFEPNSAEVFINDRISLYFVQKNLEHRER